MQIVMGAQSCGFGPAAKLVAVSRLLRGHRRVFVGGSVALDFARANRDAFDAIVDQDHLAESNVRGLIAASGLVISVMSADLVFRATEARTDAVLIDSLFPFWKLERSIQDIEQTVNAARSSTSALATLSEHERVIAAHLLARRSLIQAVGGVRERLAQMPVKVRESAIVTSPIVDAPSLAHARDSQGRQTSARLVINIGGFQNFYLDYRNNNQYLRLIRRWVADLVRDRPQLSPAIVCSGAYGQQHSEMSATRVKDVAFRLLPQPDFFTAVQNSPYYFLTPGFTALCEAVALRRLPLALPEQHYGHVFNIRTFGKATFGRMACRLSDCLPDYSVPESDLLGTRVIAEYAGRIVSDDNVYARFREAMNNRIDEYLRLPEQEVAAGIKEIEEVFSGMDLDAALNITISHS